MRSERHLDERSEERSPPLQHEGANEAGAPPRSTNLPMVRLPGKMLQLADDVEVVEGAQLIVGLARLGVRRRVFVGRMPNA